jgi:hypothetical protein
MPGPAAVDGRALPHDALETPRLGAVEEFAKGQPDRSASGWACVTAVRTSRCSATCGAISGRSDLPSPSQEWPSGLRASSSPRREHTCGPCSAPASGAATCLSVSLCAGRVSRTSNALPAQRPRHRLDERRVRGRLPRGVMRVLIQPRRELRDLRLEPGDLLGLRRGKSCRW